MKLFDFKIKPPLRINFGILRQLFHLNFLIAEDLLISGFPIIHMQTKDSTAILLIINFPLPKKHLNYLRCLDISFCNTMDIPSHRQIIGETLANFGH